MAGGPQVWTNLAEAMVPVLQVTREVNQIQPGCNGRIGIVSGSGAVPDGSACNTASGLTVAGGCSSRWKPSWRFPKPEPVGHGMKYFV